MRPKQLEKFKSFLQANPEFSEEFAASYHESMPAISPPQMERGFHASSTEEARAVIDRKQPILILCGTLAKTEAFREAFPDIQDRIRFFNFFEDGCFVVIDRVPMQVK